MICESCKIPMHLVGAEMYGADADGNRGRELFTYHCDGCDNEVFVWVKGDDDEFDPDRAYDEARDRDLYDY
jgi:hypothetical protein